MANDNSLDPLDTCFSMLTPQRSYTFSHRRSPCRYEEPITAREASTPIQQCPFKVEGYCTGVLEEKSDRGGRLYQTLNEKLSKAYPERIKNVLSEPSTSVVIRSEQQFHLQDLDRFAQRRHFYEVTQNGTPGDESRFGIDCVQYTTEKVTATGKATVPCRLINDNDRFGEYLGFVDLRQHYQAAPLAFGLLVEPRWIRENPDIFIINGDLGPLFGAHSFRCTAYSMQDPNTIGAVCAQMCAIMVLGMLSDRRVEVKGSFTLTYLAWLPWTDRGSLSHPPVPPGTYHVDGLTPDQLCAVLRACNANPVLTRIGDQKECADGLAIRLIEANVLARFPVVLSVDSQEWYAPRRTLRNNAAEENREARIEGHAVTIVGVRRDASTKKTTAFIVHDPGSGPFMQVATERCLRAARNLHLCFGKSPDGKPEWKPGQITHFVVGATHEIRRHARTCIEWLQCLDYLPFSDVYLHPNGNPQTFKAYRTREPDTDYQIRLFDKESLKWYLGPLLSPRARPGRTTLHEHLSNLPDSKFWAVLGLRRESDCLNMALSVLWIFDAREDSCLPPVKKIWFDRDGNLICYSRPEMRHIAIEVELPEQSSGRLQENQTHNSLDHKPRSVRNDDNAESPPALLEPAVMTSSSERSFQDLFGEVTSVSNVDAFDVGVTRRIDLSRLGIISGAQDDFKRMSYVLSNNKYYQKISNWLIGESKSHHIRVPCLATYFPDITSSNEEDCAKAIEALTNVVKLAIDLTQNHREDQQGVAWMKHAIVELVCGTIVDPCEEGPRRVNMGDTHRPPRHRRSVSAPNDKLELLCQSLEKVIENVKREKGDDSKFALALEMEPGETYVFNGIDSIRNLTLMLDQNDSLKNHVGYNLDIAHMRIAGVPAEALEPYQKKFVHSHIADHPGMHTHDQFVGSWTYPGYLTGGYRKYIELLLRRAKQDSENPSALPFSHAIAIELEGCNRIFSIHDSIARLKHVIQLAAARLEGSR